MTCEIKQMQLPDRLEVVSYIEHNGEKWVLIPLDDYVSELEFVEAQEGC